MQKLSAIFIILHFISCINEGKHKTIDPAEKFYPTSKSLWVAEKVLGEPKPDFKTYFYFANDSLFMELYKMDIEREISEMYFSNLSNSFTVQAYFVKRNGYYLMGRDDWSFDVTMELKQTTDHTFILTLEQINSEFPRKFKYHLRKTNPTDAIEFEYKKYYQEKLESFLSDTIVAYGLKNGVQKIILKHRGDEIEEVNLIRKEINLANPAQGVYSDTTKNRLYLITRH